MASLLLINFENTAFRSESSETEYYVDEQQLKKLYKNINFKSKYNKKIRFLLVSDKLQEVISASIAFEKTGISNKITNLYDLYIVLWFFNYYTLHENIENTLQVLISDNRM